MPKVTLIITQRERFSFTQPSLESIYYHTNLPFDLMYVDGNSPNDIQQYLAAQSQEKGLALLILEWNNNGLSSFED